MFKAECKKTIQYNLKVSEDIVKFCQWITDEDEVLDEIYDIMDLLDAIANKVRCLPIRDDEINIEY